LEAKARAETFKATRRVHEMLQEDLGNEKYLEFMAFYSNTEGQSLPSMGSLL